MIFGIDVWAIHIDDITWQIQSYSSNVVTDLMPFKKLSESGAMKSQNNRLL